MTKRVASHVILLSLLAVGTAHAGEARTVTGYVAGAGYSTIMKAGSEKQCQNMVKVLNGLQKSENTFACSDAELAIENGASVLYSSGVALGYADTQVCVAIAAGLNKAFPKREFTCKKPS